MQPTIVLVHGASADPALSIREAAAVQVVA